VSVSTSTERAVADSTYAPQIVSIWNARLTDRLSLDREGFDLVRFKFRVANFYDEKEVQTVLYREVERLLRKLTDASRVSVFDHIVRCAPMARRGENDAKEPAKGVHNDYTASSGSKRVRDLFLEEAEELLKHRFAIIDFWKPTHGPFWTRRVPFATPPPSRLLTSSSLSCATRTESARLTRSATILSIAGTISLKCKRTRLC
jgi:hypothetical protein